MENYQIAQHWAANEDFQNIFKIGLRDFFDGFLTVITKKVCINPFLFDDYLHRKYGEYEKRGLSMEDVVRENYGEEGVRLLNKLL